MPSLKHSILSGTAALSVSTIATRIASFLSLLLITRSMSLFEYGSLTLALTVAGPLAFFSGLGLDEVVVADSARAIGESRLGVAKKRYNSFVRQKLLMTAVLFAVGWVFVGPLTHKFGQVFADYFFWIFFWALSNTLASFFGILLQIHGKFTVISLMNGADSLIRLVFLALLFIFSGITPIGVIAASLAAKLFSLLFGLPQARNLLGLWRGVKAEGLGTIGLLRAHGKWSAVSQGIIPQIDNTARPWMTNLFFGPEAVALISVAGSLFGSLSILFPIQRVIGPAIAHTINDRPRAERIAQRAIKLNVWVSSLLLVVSSIAIVPFIQWFFPQYQKSIILFWVLVPRLVLLAIGSGHDSFFQALQLQKRLARYQLIGIISDLIILPLSFVVFGLSGMFVERFIAIAASTALRERFLAKKYSIKTILPRSYFSFTPEDKLFAKEMILNFRRKFGARPPMGPQGLMRP